MTNYLSRFVFLAAFLGSAPALAACYDVFGCSNRNIFRAEDLWDGPNCDFLYMMRNSIYQERGYCFSTPRAIATFGNAGCRYDNVNEVPLNGVERENVTTILSIERGKHCPR